MPKKYLTYLYTASFIFLLLIGGVLFYFYNNKFSNNLVSTNNNEYIIKAKELDELKFNKNTPLVSIKDKALNLSISYDTQQSKTESELQGTKEILYKNIEHNVDLKYTPLDNGFKEEVIINSIEVVKNRPDSNYTFNLNLSGFNYTIDDNGFVAATFTSKSDSKIIYSIPPAFMVDKKGVRSDDVQTIIRKKGDKEGEFLITLIPNKEWLLDASREYPVIIDPTVVKGSAPISNWNFDEGYGTTTADSSTNSNALTITNAAWQVNNVNSGNYVGAKHLRFDGTGDYLSRDYDSDFDFGTGSFSISMWVRIPINSTFYTVMLSRFNGAGFKIYKNTDNNICFAINGGATWYPDDLACAGSYNDAKWHHIEAVKNSTSSIILYVDGREVAKDVSLNASSSLSGSSPTLYIGVNSDGTSNSFNGDMDNITIYNYARDASQVKADAVSGSQTGVSFSQSKNTLQDGLVGHWVFDNSLTVDSSGNQNTLSQVNTPVSTVGKFGSGVDLEFGDTDYLYVTDNSTLSMGDNSFTVCTWIKPESVQTQNIVHKGVGESAGFNEYQLRLATSNFQFVVGNVSSNGTITTSSSYTAGNWYFVCGLHDAEKDQINIFVNGSYSTPVTWSGGSNDGTGDFRIGARNAGIASFDGIIDEARVYKKLLSPSELSRLYNYAPGPIAYWDFNEGSGNTLIDKTGNGYNGTMTGTVNWTQGKFGKAIDFERNDSNNPVISRTVLEGKNAFSVSFWLYQQMGLSFSTVIGENKQTPAFSIDLNMTGTSMQVLLNDSNVLTTIPVYNKEWHHYAFTWDKNGGSNNAKMYVDGVFFNQSSFSSDLNAWTSDLNIGGVSAYDGDYDAIIDEVKVYSYARTAGQVIEDMNGGHPVGGSPVGSQVGYWKFDEMQGGYTYDFSPQGNDLEFHPSGTSWTSAGKFGGAYAGISNKRWFKDTTDLSFGATDSFSLSGWIKRSTISNQEWIITKEFDNNGYGVYMDSDGDIVFGIGDENSVSFPEETIGGSLSKNYDDDTWHHFVALKESNTAIRLYVDGVEIASDTSLAADASLDTGTYSFLIGDRDNTDGTNEFLGTIDEVKIYRTALTPDQVKTEFNGGVAIKIGSKSTSSTPGVSADSTSSEFCVPGDTSPCNPPVGWWKLDENSGSSTYDSAGNMAAGTLTAGATWSQGKNGSGVKLGVTDDYVTIPDPGTDSVLDFSNGETITIEVWVKPLVLPGLGSYDIVLTKGGTNGTDTTNYIMEIGNVGGNNIFDICWQSSSYTCYVTQSDKIQAGVWQHLAFVIPFGSASNSTVKAFYNGKPEAVSCSGTCNVSPTVSNDPLWIGAAEYDGGGIDQEINAIIDDVRIYNYERTPAQIAWDYNKGAPLLWYKFNECSGTTINNWGPNSNGGYLNYPGTLSLNGTPASEGSCLAPTPNASWYVGSNGKYGSSFYFDSIDDFVDISDIDALDGISQMTISAWIKKNINGNYRRIICKQAAGGWCLRGTTANGSLTGIAFDFNAFDTNYGYTTNDKINSNIWYHVVAVYNGSGATDADKVKIYINGLPQTLTYSGTISSTLPTNTNKVRIGSNSSNIGYWGGYIDDLRVYNYALTPTQIKTIMNDGAVNFQ